MELSALNAHHRLPDGTSIGLLQTGGSVTPRPAVLLLSEIFGVNAAMKDAATAFAAAGYLVVAPDLYHRIAPATALLYSSTEREQAIALWSRLDTATTLADLRALGDWLRGRPDCTGQLAAVGFCLGGQLALLTALAESVDAAVAFYPVRVPDYAARLVDLTRPVQVHVGDADPHLPPPILDQLRQGLAAAPDALRIYPGADHGFFNRVRTVGFHPAHAAAAQDASLAFLAAHLAPPPAEDR